jgi:histidyl-tRNA synthetase
MVQNVRGTKDIIPAESFQWQYLERKIRSIVCRYGYNEIRTPIFEKTEVFSRGIGEVSDIVNKEMYTFEDRSGNSLTLRPEMTAALVRSSIQHKLVYGNHVERLWYYGPFFRYERPQKGRQRMFHQFGIECLGSANPESDSEVIILADHLLKELGIHNYKLFVNSIGGKDCRDKYSSALREYLQDNFESLSEDSKIRFDKNPLRILDSKDKSDIDLIKNAPRITDYLSDDSLYKYNETKNILDSVGIAYIEDHNLVRGLDYYSDVVFEFKSDALGAQDSFGGGGRYDHLFEQLGGSSIPAVGFAIGIERLMLMLEAQNLLPSDPGPDFAVVLGQPEESEYRSKVASILRGRGYSVVTDLLRKSFKSQFKDANRINATYTIILGEEEVEEDFITVKRMKDGMQFIVKLSELTDYEF